MGFNKLTSLEKVSILLIGLGPDVAAEIFKQLGESEVRRISATINRLGRIDDETIAHVLEEFHGVLKENKKIFAGGSGFTNKVLLKAFSGDKAERLVRDVVTPSESTLSALDLYDAKSLAQVIRKEQPQTIAIILAHLDGKKCGETLKLLPAALYTEILYRIATLDTVDPAMIDEINDFLTKEAQQATTWQRKSLGGVEKLASILSAMDKQSEEKMLGALNERDPELSELVRAKMLVFEDLIQIDGRGIQELLKVVPAAVWKVALKQASSQVKEHIFANMSPRGANLLKEDMLAMGKIRVTEVDAAQAQILAAVRKLEDEGKLQLERDKAQYV